MKKSIAIWIIAFSITLQLQADWQSQIVYHEGDSTLAYVSDAEGNRIPDFSYAGYKGGLEPIPDIPVVKTLAPVEGDNTVRIMNALFQVYYMLKDENGFHGALLLEPGIWEITGSIKFKYPGVILRGSGDGEDPETNTILWATGNTPSQRTVLVAGGGGTSKWSEKVTGTQTNITSDTVFVGTREFEIANVSAYAIGDNIIIYHPCTDAWLQSIDYGGTHSGEGEAEPEDKPWEPGKYPLVFNRYIIDIHDSRITIDAPVFNTLIRELSQSYIYKYSRNNLKAGIGIENLRIDIETFGGTDEAHAWQALDLFQIEDAWVRNCTFLHFGQSGIRCNTASRITVENCRALDPVSIITGERRYNFNVYTASQQILFKNCHASNGRHHYISNGTSYTSGCVFLDCTSTGAYASSEGHRGWSMGLLFDNLVELNGPRPGLNPRLLGLYNRGYYGTSHGWAIANSVAWNCNVANGYLIVQKPPTAQNYAIGCAGYRITGKLPYAEFNEPEGYIEGANQAGLLPRSLYLAQLRERQKGQTVRLMREPKPGTAKFMLSANYPNPFNAETVIPFSIDKSSFIRLAVYDLMGRNVAILAESELTSGDYRCSWSGMDRSGRVLPSGVYIYTLSANGLTQTGKMLLLR